MSSACPGYVELHARSAFSFLRGASPPAQLVAQAARLQIPALALTDRDGVYGIPRLHRAAAEQGIRPITGAELTMEDGSVLPVLVRSVTGYRNLCHLLTRAHLRGAKGNAPVFWHELSEFSDGWVALTGDTEGPLLRAIASGDPSAPEGVLQRLASAFGKDNVYVEMQRHLLRGEALLHERLLHLCQRHGLPPLATGGVSGAQRQDREILDLFTCMRLHTTLDAAGCALAPNNECHLRPAAEMARLFAHIPEAVANSVRLAETLPFTLKDLDYGFPEHPVPPGETMDSFLRKVTFAGARARYSHLSHRVLAQLERELALIERLGFCGYFLVVWDLVNFCTSRNILVQGRGSAANSVVCYALGITACDPIACELLFERFLSEGRTTWPDIDLDLPSGSRREEVIQEVYRRYAPEGAAMTANVITFRGRSAMREIGKALGFEPAILSRFSALFASGDFPHTLALKQQLQKAGLSPAHPRFETTARLYGALRHLPRHLGQHSGGMILSRGRLSSVVPLERASMEGRVVAQWDKYDCEELGIIKVDLLGLGMMAVLQDTLELCDERQRPVDWATIPKDDPDTYALMQAADTIGVFQIESRAQMATLPRLKPQCFYDVVVEVAIIRPGPIQGDMVHPYLARRSGKEAVTYLHPDLEPVLRRTLGVALFQEQLLRIAMVIAGFSATEAEELRRALSDMRSRERMERVCDKLRTKMRERGHADTLVERVLQSMRSFALYGFPESHAISFALIAYSSAWMKVHRAAEFYTALLNNQPMGFYSSATLIQDAKAHGIRVLPASILHSSWRCTVEDDRTLRLGLCMIRALSENNALRLLQARTASPFVSVADVQRRGGLHREELRSMARAGALQGLAAHRREALWRVQEPVEEDLFSRVAACKTEPAPAQAEIPTPTEPDCPLLPMSTPERLKADFATTGVTVGQHPMRLVRAHLPPVHTAAQVRAAEDGRFVTTAGMVICRQRPGTAKGFVFVSLEDETGISNVVVEPRLFERMRLLIAQENFLQISGFVQQREGVTHLQARRIEAIRSSLPSSPSHDFH
jgi:error-prone DNA polymerase